MVKSRSINAVLALTLISASLFSSFAFAVETVRVRLGSGRAEVHSPILQSDPEKLKQVELELLLDEDLASLITAQEIRILTMDLDIDAQTSARKIHKEIRENLIHSYDVDGVNDSENENSDSYDAQEDWTSSDSQRGSHYNNWPNLKQWTFEMEAIEDGEWEALGVSLFNSFRRWISETVNWLLVNIFKIIVCLILGSFLYRLAPEIQKRSLIYLRRNPIFSFALGWLFLLLLGAGSIALLLSLVGIPFFFVLLLILFILFFLGYILVSQLFLFFVSKLLPFVWFDSTVLRLLAGLVLITILEYYVPYFAYITAFLVMGGFGAQIKEMLSSSPRASVRGA